MPFKEDQVCRLSFLLELCCPLPGAAWCWRRALDMAQIGRTKVFLRAGIMAVLDAMRLERLNHAATVIQRRLRTRRTRARFLALRAATLKGQARWRGQGPMARLTFSPCLLPRLPLCLLRNALPFCLSEGLREYTCLWNALFLCLRGAGPAGVRAAEGAGGSCNHDPGSLPGVPGPPGGTGRQEGSHGHHPPGLHKSQ